MAGALWAIAFGLFVLLTLYPFAIYPLVLRLLPRAAPVSPGPGGQSFALLFCAYNEAKALPDVLARLSEVKRIWPDLRIRAFNDLSSDGTGALLEEASDILEVIHATDRTGKPAGMRRLLAETAEDVCLFMDANVLVAPETLPHFRYYFADPAVGAVAATVSLSNPGAGAVAATGSAFWRLEEHIKALESRTGSTMGCDGALFAARRRWYPAFPPDLADDMRVSFEAIFQGERCLSAPDILAFEPAATASGDEFRRKRRIACGAWSTHRHMRQGLAR
ncbi:MAG: glycosyltransferase, partial [Pseudomonadota bacterium]